jgi:hypothetical protein
LGSEFQFQNQEIGISVHWGRRGQVASGKVTSSSSPVAVGAVSWAPAGGRRDMSMSMARAAPMEDMLLRLYVVGFVVLLLELLSHSTDQDAVGTKRKLSLSRCL